MNEAIYRVPLRNRLLRGIMRPAFRGIYRLISSVAIEGTHNIPTSGAYLIAINHISLYDPPFVLCFWPETVEAAGAVELWERKGISLLVRMYGVIKVHRYQYDRALMDKMVNILKSGFPLLIAPEGGRSHEPGLRCAHPGVAYLVDITQVPIIPVGVIGSTDDFLSQGLRMKRPTINMRIGEPFSLPPLEGRGTERRATRQRNADEIMRHIAALLPKEYQGVYAPEGAKDDLSQPDPA